MNHFKLLDHLNHFNHSDCITLTLHQQIFFLAYKVVEIDEQTNIHIKGNENIRNNQESRFFCTEILILRCFFFGRIFNISCEH